MSITYRCQGCGAWQTARESLAGRSVSCPDCKASNALPKQSGHAALFDREFDLSAQTDPAAVESGAASGGSSGTWGNRSSSTAASPEERGYGRGAWSGAWGVLGFIALISLKLFLRFPANNNRPARPPAPAPVFRIPAEPAVTRFPSLREATPLPPLPDLPPGREIEPGIMLYELRLGGKNAPEINPPRLQGHTPGSATRLWVYLPKQKATAPRSLPCVLIAPAGSNLLAGMPLVEDDRPEHLPYVRAGFAVIAFDLEGYGAELAIAGQQRLQGPGLARVVRSSGLVANLTSFLQASAGLANGRVALAYASTKVQAIDPSRLYVAGHSSAGTFALLFAENEARIKACLAYAPVIDLAQRLDPRAKPLIRSVAGNGFMERYSPRAMESSLKCPVFLFASEDDGDSLDDARASSRRLEQAGKNVTLEKAETGGHYDSMIEQGIPRGIEWLKKIDANRGVAGRK